ncbi:DnaB-like helicase C-terminal domain-containing protein [Candidatus Phytoplasma sacchari]|uniref:SF4 helicase domain-containing protein n=1 Tax=Candidatus Phytoplasma sacchari TaxID=2609813 RepID=A0ABY7M0H8_9MOLU|nr:hypothetical protein O7R10_01285 [Candidatus Phytoplasma sacchari]
MTAKTLFHQLKKTITNRNQENFLGWKTGFRSLDEIILDYQPESFIILASQPGIEKTTFMLNMILKVLDHNKHFKIAVFSLE